LKWKTYGKLVTLVTLVLAATNTWSGLQVYFLSLENRRLQEFEPIIQGFARGVLVVKSVESRHNLLISIIVISPHSGYAVVRPGSLSYHKDALKYLDSKRLSDNELVFKTNVTVATSQGSYQRDLEVPVGLLLFLDYGKFLEEGTIGALFPLGNATCTVEYHDAQTGRTITAEFYVTIMYIYGKGIEYSY